MEIQSQIKEEIIRPEEALAAYAQAEAFYGEGLILEIPIEEELIFEKNSQFIPEEGKSCLAWMEADIQYRIQKTPAGYVYHEPVRTDNIFYNGRKLADLEPDPEFGESSRCMIWMC